MTDYLMHYGIKGMKWGRRRYQNEDGSLTEKGRKHYKVHSNKIKPKIEYSNDKTVIEKGTDIHRFVPGDWEDRERQIKSGRAYASYKKSDVEKYKKIAYMFGEEVGDNYIDMNFKAKNILISPSKKERIDAFVNLVSEDPNFKNAFIKSTRNPFVHVGKKVINNLSVGEKKTDKAFNNFSYLIATKKDLRDPYFKMLEKQGYAMIIDDADKTGKISDSPIIVFDRSKSLDLKSMKKLSELKKENAND